MSATPRTVTRAQIEGLIKYKGFYRPVDAMTDAEIPESVKLITCCVLVLDNGFTIHGKSACVDPASYNKEVGEHWALEDAISQVWPLLAYQLKEEMYQDAPPKEEEMNFGEALLRIRGGGRCTRAGWNGKGMFVYLVPAASYPVQTGAAKAHFGEKAMVPYNAYMALVGANGTVSTWVPSVSDCLAKDWMMVPHTQSV